MLQPRQQVRVDSRRQINQLRNKNRGDQKNEPRDEQPAVERGELTRFLSQSFVRQHRAELLEHEVQIEQKKKCRQDEDEQRGIEEKLARHFILPIEKRTQAEVHESEQFGAVERIAPGTFRLLEMADLQKSVKQKQADDDRRNDARRREHVGAGGFRADDQPRGQTPEQGGKSAREFAQRAEQFWIRCGIGHFIKV